MLLLVLAGLRILVLEDEVYLGLSAALPRKSCFSYLVGGTTLVGAKHDYVGRGIREFLSVKLLVVAQELHICTTAFQTSLELNLVLDNQSLPLVIDF